MNILKMFRKEKEKQQVEEPRLDSYGRVCVQPDPVDSQAFTLYAEVHGIKAARAAFGLWEDDPY